MASELNTLQPSVNRSLPFCAGFLLIVLLAAVCAPWFSSYAVGGFEEKRLLESPSSAHWMGTDGLGRDLLTRVLYGARVSITVGLGTALIALIIGTTYGLIAGFKGGNWDHAMMRIVDLFYGLPDMLIFILLSLLFGRNIGGLLVALGLVSWVRFAPANCRAPYLAKYHRADHRDVNLQHSVRHPCRIDAQLHRHRYQRPLQRMGHQLGHARAGRLPRHAQLSACHRLPRSGDFFDDSLAEYFGQRSA